MPCTNCGKLLCVRNDDPRTLFCPHCEGLSVESQAVVNAKTEFLIKDHLPEHVIHSLLTQYKKHSLTYFLISRLNDAASNFLSAAEVPLPKDEFGFVPYILRQIYKIDTGEFGDNVIKQDSSDLTSAIKTVRQYYTEYVGRYERAQNQHTVCIRTDKFTGEWENFPSDYDRRLSEYGVAFNRCSNSVGGDQEDYDLFDLVQGEIRRVNKTDPHDAETTREFADAWYELIQQFRFVAGSDDRVGPTYYTPFPAGVTVFQIEEFLERIHGVLNEVLDDEMWEAFENNSYVPPLREDWVNHCGEATFGDAWEQVKSLLIVSDDNLDAHPFLFKIVVQEQETSSGRSMTISNIYYPQNYAFLLKFQVFPMLKNDEGTPNGHDLLSQVAGERGTERERNLYNFITDQGIKCYHSAEITRSDPNEIDILCIDEDRVLFIEVKYFFPPLRIDGMEGITELNQKFNSRIFKEIPPDTDEKPSGKPFPVKINTWRELNSGDSFTSQISSAGEREKQRLPTQWNELDTHRLVVSNVVPSYIEKQGVRFLTDLEFCKWLQHSDESHLYRVE